jgi:hypothetical protein
VRAKNERLYQTYRVTRVNYDLEPKVDQAFQIPLRASHPISCRGEVVIHLVVRADPYLLSLDLTPTSIEQVAEVRWVWVWAFG